MNSILNNLKLLKNILSPLTAFFAGTLITCCAYGLLSSTLAVRLAENGSNTFSAGIILAFYYIGYIAAALSAYKIVNQVGHIRAFSTYISLFSAIALLHFFSPNLIYWGVLRFLEGYCIGSAFLCLESWLNARATNANRGMIMSFYMISTYLGSSLGQLLLNIPDKSGVVIYITVSVLLSVALVPISLTALPMPNLTKHKNMSLKELYKKSPVGVVGCYISGIFVGGFYILGAIYAHNIGLDLQQTSLFMFFGVLGGMSVQLPIGKISDQMDRRKLMMYLCVFLICAAPLIHIFAAKGNLAIIICSFLLGSGTFILYPISVSHINDLVDDEERTEASGVLILLQSLGMISGPIMVSFFMQNFGAICFVLAYVFSACFFIWFTKAHLVKKPDINYTNPSPTYPIPTDSTHLLHKISEDTSIVDKAKELISQEEKKL